MIGALVHMSATPFAIPTVVNKLGGISDALPECDTPEIRGFQQSLAARQGERVEKKCHTQAPRCTSAHVRHVSVAGRILILGY